MRAGMFSNLLDFAYVRSASQALGWYIVYLVGTIVMSAVVGAIVVAISRPRGGFTSGFDMGNIVGNVVAFCITVVLSVMLVVKRGRGGDAQSLAIVVVAAIGAALGGGLLGLIGPAYLSTRSHLDPT